MSVLDPNIEVMIVNIYDMHRNIVELVAQYIIIIQTHYVNVIPGLCAADIVKSWGPDAAEQHWKENAEMVQRCADAALSQEMGEISPTAPFALADFPGY